MEGGRSPSLEARHRDLLPDAGREALNRPRGRLDEARRGLHGKAKETPFTGAAPAGMGAAGAAPRLRQLSSNPFVPSPTARLLCAQHNIEACF